MNRNMFKNLFKKPQKTIRDITVESLYKAIVEYDKWYSNCGLYLPPDYASDPSGWTEELHKIARAFKLMDDKNHETGEIWNEPDLKKREELENEVRSGFFLFGKYLFWLTDQK